MVYIEHDTYEKLMNFVKGTRSGELSPNESARQAKLLLILLRDWYADPLGKEEELGELAITWLFMRDNHTFVRMKGSDFSEIQQIASALAKRNPYGMLCKPIVVSPDGKEITRLGDTQHVDGEGKVDIQEWVFNLIDYKAVREWKSK